MATEGSGKYNYKEIAPVDDHGLAALFGLNVAGVFDLAANLAFTIVYLLIFAQSLTENITTVFVIATVTSVAGLELIAFGVAWWIEWGYCSHGGIEKLIIGDFQDVTLLTLKLRYWERLYLTPWSLVWFKNGFMLLMMAIPIYIVQGRQGTCQIGDLACLSLANNSIFNFVVFGLFILFGLNFLRTWEALRQAWRFKPTRYRARNQPRQAHPHPKQGYN